MANVICTLLKDEDNLVVDFVVHHLAIGFDRIIIFDDLSAIPVSDLISTTPEKIRAKVICHRLRSDYYEWGTDSDASYMDESLFIQFRQTKQMYFCNLALAHHVAPTDWVAFIDVDEFIWPGEHGSIAGLRAKVEETGFSAVIFPMSVYGHGFNVAPPADNNICAFLWRARNLYGHGKFFAQAGSIQITKDIHFPTLHNQRLLCDTSFTLRKQVFDSNPPVLSSSRVTHIKHYMIQDVFTCFSRRMRRRISQRPPVSSGSPTWLDRIGWLDRSSEVADFEMAALLVLNRVRAGMNVDAHARALSGALNQIPQTERLGSGIDFNYLRTTMGTGPEETNAELLFRYFKQDAPNRSMLRLETPPDDFNTDEYQSLYGDLKALNLTKRQLLDHYLRYGRREGRAYKRALKPQDTGHGGV